MSTSPIDLRSDTVTRPTAAMRRAMADADVGDDVYGEDPTVLRLQAMVAEMLGKDAALFVPSGTMSNQIALSLSTRPGDEVVVADDTHCESFESGAAAALSGVQFRQCGPATTLEPEDVAVAVRPDHDALPRTRLIVLENSHNGGGGTVLTAGRSAALVAMARKHGLAAHLDGARLWNAAVALDTSVSVLAEPFDTVSVCFSKGLGAPVGSALAGGLEVIREARRIRKRLGGGMRQVGILAAAAIHGLTHHRVRLAEDHENARLLAEALASTPAVIVDPASVQTNIVRFSLEASANPHLTEDARRAGVLLQELNPGSFRAVTHLDVSRQEIVSAAETLRRCIEQRRAAAPR